MAPRAIDLGSRGARFNAKPLGRGLLGDSGSYPLPLALSNRIIAYGPSKILLSPGRFKSNTSIGRDNMARKGTLDTGLVGGSYFANAEERGNGSRTETCVCHQGAAAETGQGALGRHKPGLA